MDGRCECSCARRNKYSILSEILLQGGYRIGDPILHIELRRWADVVLIAPCSANTLSKIAHGICDNLVVRLRLFHSTSYDMHPFSDVVAACSGSDDAYLCLSRHEYIDVRTPLDERPYPHRA